jgi:hypothetical protein
MSGYDRDLLEQHEDDEEHERVLLLHALPRENWRVTEALPQVDAARLLLAAIAGREPAGGLYEIRYRARGERGMRQMFHRLDRPESLVEVTIGLGRHADVYIGCAPRRERHGGRAAINNVWTLWADIDTPGAVERLAAFSPWPAIVVHTSPGHLHAWWSLRDPLRTDQAEEANRRLVAYLGADARSTDAARILRMPGTLNHKHDPPYHVEAVRVDVPGRAPTASENLSDVPELVNAEPPDRAVTRLRARRADGPFGDALAAIPASEYVEVLVGRLSRDGKTTCPFHGGGQERTPSLHAYPDPRRGWFCYGCDDGGDIFTLGAKLYGLAVRRDFPEIRRRLAADLLRATDTAA